MELRDYLEILKRRKWIVALSSITVFAVISLGTLLATPVYSASTLIRIADSQEDSASNSQIVYADRLINTYAQLLRSRPFLEQVSRRLDLKVDPGTLAETVKVESLTNTELIKITVESPYPELAMAIANTLGGLLVEERQRVYAGNGRPVHEVIQEQLMLVGSELSDARSRLAALSQQSTLEQSVVMSDLNARIASREQTYNVLLSQYDRARVEDALRANSISIVEPAISPPYPARPRALLYLVLGLLIGVLAGVGLAFLADNLDPTIQSSRAVERVAGATVAGWIPKMRPARGDQDGGLLAIGDGGEAGSEAFRILGASTLGVTRGITPRTILVTSPEAGAGRSTIAANLAAVIAQDDRRVILVDCDLEHPAVHEIFGLPMGVGLVNAMRDIQTLTLAVQETDIPGLRVVTRGAGMARSDATRALSGLRTLIPALSKKADLVILDGPPVLTSANAALMASMVDGAILVVGQGHSTIEGVERSLGILHRAGGRILGIAFNMGRGRPPGQIWSPSPLTDNQHAEGMRVAEPA